MRKSWQTPMHSCRHTVAEDKLFVDGRWYRFETECGMAATVDDEHFLVVELGGYHCPWCGGLMNREGVLHALGGLDD